MATATGLPPLDPLVKANAKRTYSVFASCPDEGMKEEEKRYVHIPVNICGAGTSAFQFTAATSGEDQ